MEVIIVLAIGGLLLWLLYGRGNPQPPATEAEIARMVPGQAINPHDYDADRAVINAWLRKELSADE